MKLELIAPSSQKSGQRLRKALVPPLNLALIAALTPPGVEVSLTDENVTAIDFQKNVDLVGITVPTLTAPRAYEIADAFRARGVKVVLGGVHPTFLPEEAGQHADAVVIGEAEGIWPSLIEDFRQNRLKKLYSQNERPSLAGLPLPRRDLFAKSKYIVSNTIAITRGCPFSCTFCSVTSFFGNSYRYRPIGEVFKEIETLKDHNPIFFVDDNIVGNPKFAKELFRALIPYKIKWIGQASVTLAGDEELLRLAAASGCVGLLIGFESLSPTNLAAVGKRINMVERYEEVIRKIHANGIAIHGSFILGLDDDDETVFERMVRFSQRMKLESAGFAVLTPLPGTSLFKSLDEAGRIDTKDWSRYDDVVYEPKLMSREVLQKGRIWALRKFFSLPSIWCRLGIRHRNLLWLWALNLAWWYHYRARW